MGTQFRFLKNTFLWNKSFFDLKKYAHSDKSNTDEQNYR